jgi:hypothetical protein
LTIKLAKSIKNTEKVYLCTYLKVEKEKGSAADLFSCDEKYHGCWQMKKGLQFLSENVKKLFEISICLKVETEKEVLLTFFRAMKSIADVGR